MSSQQYVMLDSLETDTMDGERNGSILEHDFPVDRRKGEDIHDRVVEHIYDSLRSRYGEDHIVAGEDITGLRDKKSDPSGLTVRAYQEEMQRLFGYEEDVGRYSVVKELPYFHLASYPEDVAAAALDDYVRNEVSENIALERPQEVGDIDVAVFDRETRTVHLKEVKGRKRHLDKGKDAVDKFAAYANAFGWDVEGDVVVFDETRRQHGNKLLIGNIEEYAVRDTRSEM